MSERLRERPGGAAHTDLVEERDFLLRSLDDLERERAAGDIDEADYTALRDDYTARAAAVLRAIDDPSPPPAADDPERPARRRRGRLLVVAGVVLLAVGAGLAVAAASGSRLPGESTTGSIRETASSRLQEAALAARQSRFTEALELYDEVIAEDPENVEALSERGLLLASLAEATGRDRLLTEGRASVEAALRADPGNPRTLFYLGLVLRLLEQDDAARAAFDEALANDPPPLLRQQIRDFLRTAGG